MFFLINRMNQQQVNALAQATSNAIRTLSNIRVQDISGATPNDTIKNFCSKFLNFSNNHSYYNFLCNKSILKVRGANHENGADENFHKFEVAGLPNIRLSLSFENKDGQPSTHKDKFGVPIIEHSIFVGHLYNDEDLRQICASIIGYLKSGKYVAPQFKQQTTKSYHQPKTNKKKQAMKQNKLQKQAQKNHREKVLQNKGIKRNKLNEIVSRIIVEAINSYLKSECKLG